MKLNTISGAVAAIAIMGTVPFTAFAGDSAEAKMARAMSAAPASISSDATIVDTDGTVLREGSNGWTCLPHTMPGDNCADVQRRHLDGHDAARSEQGRVRG